MKQFPAHIRIDSVTQNEIIQTVQQHCDACAEFASETLAGIGLGKTAALSGRMHDGKMTQAFGEYLLACAHGRPVRRGSVNHTFAPVRYLLTRYHTTDADGIKALTAELICYAIGAHHGLFDCASDSDENGFDHRLQWEDTLYAEHMENFLQYDMSQDEIDQLFCAAVQEIRKIGEKIPGMASDVERNFAFGALARLLLSAVIEGDRRDTAIFMHGGKPLPEASVDWNACLQTLEKYLNHMKPGPLSEPRRYISEQCRKQGESTGTLFRLNVPTGAGKTLAALRFALTQCAYRGKKRIFFVMPLIAIIDQNVKQIREALGDTVEVLEHHSNVIVPRQGDDELDIRELLCESWRTHIVCTTLVQFLDTLFRGRTTCIRRFQALCESVIILDEVQSVPIRMLSQFNLMINFLTQVCGATVVLCSATQAAEPVVQHPLLPAIEMVPYDAARFSKFRRTEILPPSGNPMTMEEIAAWSYMQLAQVDTLLLICNTRAQAAALFLYLRAAGMPCIHLSGAMCTAHRRKVLARICALRPGEKQICVSTQVMEAGVDASLQREGRFLSGLDNIIQAAGRCNRHGEWQMLGQVQILSLKGERLPPGLQEIANGQTATQILLSRFRDDPAQFDGRLDSNAAIQTYYRLLFSGLKQDSMDYPLPGRKNSTMLDLLSVNTASNEADGTRYYLHQAFKQAGAQFCVFPEESVDLVVPYGEAKELLYKLSTIAPSDSFTALQDLVHRLHPFTVSVYQNELKALRSAGAVDVLWPDTLGILTVREEFYDPMRGLVLSQKQNDKEV